MTTIAEYADQAYAESWPVENVERMAEALEAIEKLHAGAPLFSTKSRPIPMTRCKQCGTASPCETLTTVHRVLGIDGKNDTE